MPAKSHKGGARRARGNQGCIASPTLRTGYGGGSIMSRKLVRSGERGQAIIEYVMILVLVAMVVIVVLMIFGPELGNAFSYISQSL